MDTIQRQPINADFEALLDRDEEQPGPPFYDKTLNFLQSQFNKTHAEVGKLTTRKYKLEDEISIKSDERETLRGLLIEEYRQRRPFHPETGELIAAPFEEAG